MATLTEVNLERMEMLLNIKSNLSETDKLEYQMYREKNMTMDTWDCLENFLADRRLV